MTDRSVGSYFITPAFILNLLFIYLREGWERRGTEIFLSRFHAQCKCVTSPMPGSISQP